jgi:8-oxo-dGTP pyrophosphatase MutT (NUDIX family)
LATVVSRTVEACVFRVAGSVPHYLLLKRSADEKLYPGMWQFVTGTIRSGERAVDAARREIVEETGLTIKRFWIVPFVSSFYAAPEDAIHMSPFFAAEVGVEAEPILSREHQEYVWHMREEAENMLVWPGQRQGLQIVHEYIVGGREASKLLSVPI